MAFSNFSGFNLSLLYQYLQCIIESFPEFSKHYLLKTKNESALREIFDYNVVEYFLENTGFSVEGNKNCFILFRRYKLLDKRQIDELTKRADEILSLFKERQGTPNI